ncbi:hypothetical protein BB560_000296 [Smittium megazygosporum]|uniref:GST N-terminal domain-containing protein n=1 Tax=Smittium megazygosporum TaxID=133381 RepID=A0A2T9ZKQ3_9FUNG|nr:hypothetical protein BB560_000296 [Smittium megazygosporum]
MSFPFDSQKLTLYSSKICPFAQRVFWALDEAGISYHLEEIDLKDKPTWYPLVNPAGKVPALRLPEGEILVESYLITEYIADKYPESNLLPSDPLEKFKVRLFIDFFSNNVLRTPYQLLGTPDSEVPQKVAEIEKALTAFNDFLVKHSPEGPYFLGDRFSLAEINTMTFIERLDMAAKMSNSLI